MRVLSGVKYSKGLYLHPLFLYQTNLVSKIYQLTKYKYVMMLQISGRFRRNDKKVKYLGNYKVHIFVTPLARAPSSFNIYV